jgi:hypothetical protein
MHPAEENKICTAWSKSIEDYVAFFSFSEEYDQYLLDTYIHIVVALFFLKLDVHYIQNIGILRLRKVGSLGCCLEETKVGCSIP